MIITLGPILQAKTNYKVLRWINRIRPFLDAFYGPYTDKYRYWPGLLLLIRVILLSLFAFYSLGDGIFKLVLIAVAISLILMIWLMIGNIIICKIYVHCRNESVYCTLNCPNTHTKYENLINACLCKFFPQNSQLEIS